MSSELPINLLAEEATIDPRSPFPSFFEMELVNSTALSGRKALASSIETLAAHLRRMSTNSPLENLHGFGLLRQKLIVILSRLISIYKAEVQLIVNYIIEKKCLCSNSASTVSETMYGLKRSKISRIDGSISEMKDYDKVRAALLSSLWPYLKQRLDTFYEKKRDEERERQLNDILSPMTSIRHQYPPTESRFRNENGINKLNLLEKMRRTFLYIYPFLHMTHDGMQLAYRFSYLIGQSFYYHPQWHLLGLVARRMTIQDVEVGKKKNKNRTGNDDSSDQSNSLLDAWDGAISDEALALLKKAVAGGMVTLLLVGWLGQLRLEIRKRRRRQMNTTARSGRGDEHSGSDREGIRNRQHNINDVNGSSDVQAEGDAIIIPPPLPPPILHQGHDGVNDSVVKPTRDKSLCPICLQKRLNAVASTSGYVFCYKCLVMHIREHGEKCPITGLQCKESQLVRLFEPNEVGHSSDAGTARTSL